MRIDRIELAAPLPGVERMQAFFEGYSFTPHRHDSYAVGMTTVGVQSFDYRGSTRHSIPGQVFVLHPDERHDGRAGDERGFGYRIAYIDPAIIRDAAQVSTLPFMCDPVSADERLRSAIVAIVGPQGDPIDEARSTCNLVSLADVLVDMARDRPSWASRIDSTAVRQVRELLLAKPDAKTSMAELETVSGLTRWQLARQFRKAYGVSIYRFHLLRRLDRARELMRLGQPLADVAQSCGFADQAHLTRKFRSAFGLSPGQWRRLCAG
jgi:AraC-like DNA-binding protein